MGLQMRFAPLTTRFGFAYTARSFGMPQQKLRRTMMNSILSESFLFTTEWGSGALTTRSLNLDNKLHQQTQPASWLSQRQLWTWLISLSAIPFGLSDSYTIQGHPNLFTQAAALLLATCIVIVHAGFPIRNQPNHYASRAFETLSVVLAICVSLTFGLSATEDAPFAVSTWLPRVTLLIAVCGIACFSGTCPRDKATLNCIGGFVAGSFWSLIPFIAQFDASIAEILQTGYLLAVAIVIYSFDDSAPAFFCISKQYLVFFLAGQAAASAWFAIPMGNPEYGMFQQFQSSNLLAVLLFALVYACACILLLAYAKSGKQSTRAFGMTPHGIAATRQRLMSLEGASLLTTRELTVLTYTAASYSTHQISQRLEVAESTVSSYRSRAYQKLHISGRQGLQTALQISSPSKEDNEKQAAQTQSNLNSGKAVILALVLVLLVPIPSDNISAFGSSDIDPSRLLALAISVLLLFVGLVVHLHHVKHHIEEHFDTVRNGSRFAAMLLGLVMPARISISIYYSWVQDRNSGLVALVALLSWPALSIAVATDKKSAKVIRTVIPNVLVEQVSYLTVDFPYFFVLCGCWLLLSVRIGDFCFFDLPIALLYVVIAASVALLLQMLSASSSKASEEPSSMDDFEKAFLYLRSIGMGELQAQIIARTARGDRLSAICDECQTTKSTVKSYRARAYKTLHVHSIEELRDLLASKTR